MKRNLVIVFGLCVVLLSCTLSHKFYNPDVQKEKDERMCLDTLQLNKLEILSATVRNLLCIDDYLIIVQKNKNELFKVLNTSNDSVIAAFGQTGHARNEFEHFPQITYCTRDKKGLPLLCVYDGVCTKILDLKKSIIANRCITTSIIKEKNDRRFYQVYHFVDRKSFLYKSASYEDPRDNIYFPPEFSFIDKGEKKWNIFPDIVKPIGFPSSADVDYNNVIVVSPDALHIACVNNFIDIVTVFDLAKGLALGIVNPNSYSFEYLENEITESDVNEQIRFYNSSACATDLHYFILENGKTLNEKDNDDMNGVENVGLKLRGYDWEGNCLFAYNINKNLSYIAYNEANHKFYATGLLNDTLYNCKLK